MTNSIYISADMCRSSLDQKPSRVNVTPDKSLIGESSAMQQVREAIRRVSRRKFPVLVQGPTGSGKELVARAIHQQSGRTGRFVGVNIAALTDTLFEAELFGHVRGAFSGASHDRGGLFRSANGGTIFLDEIGELQPSLQAKLLRVLDEHEVRPVGSDVGIKVDLRVVAATNADLEARVRQGAFRPDLFYRLQGAGIVLRPLADRSEDIPILVAHFLDRIAVEHEESPMIFLPDSLAALRRYDWPGNIRELQQVLGRIAGEIDTHVVTVDDVYRALPNVKEQSSAVDPTSSAAGMIELKGQLEKCGYDIDEVAKMLSVTPSTIYRRMHRLGIPVGPRGPRPKRYPTGSNE